MSQYHAIAEYYDAEYESREMLAQDVPFFLGHLPRRRQRVLELAVGTARAAIPMAQAGHRVLGVDVDAQMLAIARRKRDAVGLKESQLSLGRQDVLRLEIAEKFDWICIFFNTFLNFTSLEDQDRLLSGVRKHLKRSGRFWLDIFNPDMHLLSQPKTMKLDPVLFYVPQLDRSVMRTADIRRDPVRQLQHVTFHYEWFDKDSRRKKARVEFDMTWLFPRELQLLLERNGLKIEAMYGNYDGGKLTNDSPRIIACCRA